MLDTSADGELVIPSGSNYEGCTIDGEEQGEAAAFTMLFVKNSRLFTEIMPGVRQCFTMQKK